MMPHPLLRRAKLAHPRLHLTPKTLTTIRERAQTTHRRYAELLQQWVREHEAWSPPVELPDAALNEVVLEECAAFVTNAALAFVVSGEAEHRDLARRWALAMCELPHGELANYGLGIYAAGLARAYDWLYHEWTDSERGRLRDHIAALVRQLYLGSFAGTPGAHWWAGAHLHHDFWVPVCGFGEAALALLGEVGEAETWAVRAWDEIEACFSWLGEDGAWHEGAADWCYALAPLLWFYGAWQSVTGEDPHDRPWLRRTAQFRLYHRLPDGTYLYLNDSFRSGRYNTSGSASCHLLRRLASLFTDGHAQWLAEQDEAFDLPPGPNGVIQAPYEGSSYGAPATEYPHPASQCAAWNPLWYDPAVEPLPPAGLPRSRRFENADLVIMRGWGGEEAVVSFSCGPLAGHRCAERMRAGEARSGSNFSHAHADYNSFTLFAGGQYFIIPPGYARRSSAFQNTVAVSGADLTPDPSVHVRLLGTAEEREFCAGVGDATAAFRSDPEVVRCWRYLVLLDGCLVLYDDLQLASLRYRQWNRFEWRLHSSPAEHRLSVQENTATWTARGTDAPRLRLHLLQPEAFTGETAAPRSLTGEPLLEALRLSRAEWYSERMRVMAVFTWDDRPPPRLVEGSGWSGAAWADGAQPIIAFPHEPGVRPAGIELHGDRPLWLFGVDANPAAAAR